MAEGVTEEMARLRAELDAARWALEDATKEIERLQSEVRLQTEMYGAMIEQMAALGVFKSVVGEQQ